MGNKNLAKLLKVLCVFTVQLEQCKVSLQSLLDLSRDFAFFDAALLLNTELELTPGLHGSGEQPLLSALSSKRRQVPFAPVCLSVHLHIVKMLGNMDRGGDRMDHNGLLPLGVGVGLSLPQTLKHTHIRPSFRLLFYLLVFWEGVAI